MTTAACAAHTTSGSWMCTGCYRFTGLWMSSSHMIGHAALRTTATRPSYSGQSHSYDRRWVRHWPHLEHPVLLNRKTKTRNEKSAPQGVLAGASVPRSSPRLLLQKLSLYIMLLFSYPVPTSFVTLLLQWSANKSQLKVQPGQQCMHAPLRHEVTDSGRASAVQPLYQRTQARCSPG